MRRVVSYGIVACFLVAALVIFFWTRHHGFGPVQILLFDCHAVDPEQARTVLDDALKSDFGIALSSKCPVIRSSTEASRQYWIELEAPKAEGDSLLAELVAHANATKDWRITTCNGRAPVGGSNSAPMWWPTGAVGDIESMDLSVAKPLSRPRSGYIYQFGWWPSQKKLIVWFSKQ